MTEKLYTNFIRDGKDFLTRTETLEQMQKRISEEVRLDRQCLDGSGQHDYEVMPNSHGLIDQCKKCGSCRA